MVKPKKRIETLCTERSHRPFPVQGVTGMVRCGLKNANSQDIREPYQYSHEVHSEIYPLTLLICFQELVPF
jgi:hypothetical protein